MDVHDKKLIANIIVAVNGSLTVYQYQYCDKISRIQS